jgi:hypothetical protein
VLTNTQTRERGGGITPERLRFHFIAMGLCPSRAQRRGTPANRLRYCAARPRQHRARRRPARSSAASGDSGSDGPGAPHPAGGAA